jgi:uncharacterized protein YifE (UPF0438 family)
MEPEEEINSFDTIEELDKFLDGNINIINDYKDLISSMKSREIVKRYCENNYQNILEFGRRNPDIDVKGYMTFKYYYEHAVNKDSKKFWKYQMKICKNKIISQISVNLI